MENFEEAIAPFTEKIVDEKNPQLVKYKFTKRLRVLTFNINNRVDVEAVMNNAKGLKNRKVRTPLGVFETMQLAAEAHSISLHNMHYWLTKGLNGCSYE